VNPRQRVLNLVGQHLGMPMADLAADLTEFSASCVRHLAWGDHRSSAPRHRSARKSSAHCTGGADRCRIHIIHEQGRAIPLGRGERLFQRARRQSCPRPARAHGFAGRSKTLGSEFSSAIVVNRSPIKWRARGRDQRRHPSDIRRPPNWWVGKPGDGIRRCTSAGAGCGQHGNGADAAACAGVPCT